MWVKDKKKPLVDTDLQVCRFTRILFGSILSPSMLGSTVKHHLESIGTPVTELAVNNIYVDSLTSEMNRSGEAIQFCKKIKQSFKEVSMSMTDW